MGGYSLFLIDWHWNFCLRKDLMHQIKNAQWSITTRHFIHASQRQEHQTRNCSVQRNTSSLSLRVSCLNPRCYLAWVLISQSKCCLWIPRGCSEGGWWRLEGADSDSDVPPSISKSWCEGDNAKSPDGISAVPEIGSIHRVSHLHHPSFQMKYNGENGQWVMEIDSKETWVVINMVPCAAKQHKTPRTTHCLPQAKVGCHCAACM